MKLFSLLILIILTPLKMELFAQDCQNIIGSPIISKESCANKTVKSYLKLYTLNYDTLEIFGIDSNVKNFKSSFKGRPINTQDTLKIIHGQTKELAIEFENELSNQKSEIEFQFKLNGENHQCKVPIFTSSFDITKTKTVDERIKRINASNSCTDSIKIFFPHEGTITSVMIYQDSLDSDSIKGFSFYAFEPTNFMTFNKNEIGKYYVQVISCWMEEDYWLYLE